MSRIRIHPDQDSETAAALYLSGLDHESLYSNDELRQAIAETAMALDEPEALIPLYLQSLLGAGAAAETVRRERRAWALRMAADLAREEGERGPGDSAAEAAEEPDPLGGGGVHGEDGGVVGAEVGAHDAESVALGGQGGVHGRGAGPRRSGGAHSAHADRYPAPVRRAS